MNISKKQIKALDRGKTTVRDLFPEVFATKESVAREVEQSIIEAIKTLGYEGHNFHCLKGYKGEDGDLEELYAPMSGTVWLKGGCVWDNGRFATLKGEGSALTIGTWYRGYDSVKSYLLCALDLEGKSFGFVDEEWAYGVYMDRGVEWHREKSKDVMPTLRLEAKRRGFKEGANFTSTGGSMEVCEGKITNHNKGDESFQLAFGCLNGLIMHDGIWGETDTHREGLHNLAI